MRTLKMWLLLSSLSIFAAVPALADSCLNFSSYQCSKATPNVVNLNGTGTTGQSVGILLGSDAFNIQIHGNKSVAGDDLVLLAAFPNGMGGTVIGVSFSALSSFPEKGAMGAIESTWSAMGTVFHAPEFGYANLGAIGCGPISVTASGVGNGTILYAAVVNPKTGMILYITPNSEAGMLKVGQAVVPEPGSPTLIGTGLLGLAGLIRRRIFNA